MFLVFFLVLMDYGLCTYTCTQSISAGRCGNHGSPSELRSEIHIPRTVPFLSASGNCGYFTSLSLLSLCLVRRLSYKPNAWISFTDSNVAALSCSWTSLFFPPQTARLGAIHQTRPTLVAVPLFTAFPISYILHLTQQYIDAAARFHTTLTEILFDTCCCPKGKLNGTPAVL
jgi:hypothetical protein